MTIQCDYLKTSFEIGLPKRNLSFHYRAVGDDFGKLGAGVVHIEDDGLNIVSHTVIGGKVTIPWSSINDVVVDTFRIGLFSVSGLTVEYGDNESVFFIAPNVLRAWMYPEVSIEIAHLIRMLRGEAVGRSTVGESR